MTYLLSFTIIMVFLLIGEWVSAATKAFVPSIFITAATGRFFLRTSFHKPRIPPNLSASPCHCC